MISILKRDPLNTKLVSKPWTEDREDAVVDYQHGEIYLPYNGITEAID